MGNQFTDTARVDVKFCYHFSSPVTRARSAVPVAFFIYIRFKNLSIHMRLLPCLKLSFRMPFNLTLNLTYGQVKMTILRLKNNLSGDISDAPTFLQPFGCLFRS